MPLLLDVHELLCWNDLSALHWRGLLQAHPEVLALPCDIRSSGDVAHLLQHIMAVELRYAQRLSSEPESPYETIPFASANELFAVHDAALARVRVLLADEAYDWSRELGFSTLSSGRLSATRRDMLVHLLLHSIRHYAQLATLVRHAGFRADWSMDFLFLNARPIA